MKKLKISLRNLTLFSALLLTLTACDKDFANIDSDIINNDNASHFDTNSSRFDVIAYTKKLEPVQTNALPLNILGLYEDPGVSYGRSTANFVSQIRGNLTDPDFGTNAVIDSVILTIPYFSTPNGTDDDGRTVYELDSVFNNNTIKLSIYENNYFLRDFDPTSSNINTAQSYYSNKSTGSNSIDDSQLEGQLLYQNLNFKADPIQIILTEGEGDDKIETSRTAPALRIKFDDDAQSFWQEKIIDAAGQPELSNLNNFNDYFRGLYFKAELDSDNNSGQMLLLDMASNASNIIIYYTRDPLAEDTERVQTTYTFNFTGNRINFLANDFDLSNGNETTGDENLFLKGGQGSIAELKLFGGNDIDSDNTTDNPFELFKKSFVETDTDGSFISSKRLINEAHLVLYVNQSEVNANGDEPNRVYLYDMNNNLPLADYFFDIENTFEPELSRSTHLVPLKRENDDAREGIRYKIRITEHLNNLILRDSTNVKLGLAVSGNINVEANTFQYDLLSENDKDKVPVSSILTPRGTVLHGNNTLDEDKKLYLEIFFTEPNN
jgi:hypothetical protein